MKAMVVAELLGLAHVVRREDDRRAPLPAQRGDLRADADGDVRVESQRRLVEEEHLGVVEQRLGQGQPLLEPRRQLVVLGLAVRPELEPLDQLAHAPREPPAAQPVQPAVEGQDLGRPQAPDEGGIAARHVEPAADREGFADDVVTQDAGRAAVGQEQGRQDREQGGLSGPVRPEQAEDGAAWDLEARAPQGLGPAPVEPARAKCLSEVARLHCDVLSRHNRLILPCRFTPSPRPLPSTGRGLG